MSEHQLPLPSILPSIPRLSQSWNLRLWLTGVILALLLGLSWLTPLRATAQELDDIDLVITGRLINAHRDPITNAVIEVTIDGRRWPVVVEDSVREAAHSADDGSFRLTLAVPKDTLSAIADGRSKLSVIVTKPTYRMVTIPVRQSGFAGPELLADVGPVTMVRLINASFIIAGLVFLLVFILISFHILHETIAALLGVG
ncbi:MAG TPA: hypothetical protein EYH31_07305, partial [Anaerolineae bacterium]|nr:hypothetical protein [Anaerolineae bacterium]